MILKKTYLFFVLIFCQYISFAQSDVDKILQGGAILINGLAFFKGNKTDAKTTAKVTDSKLIPSICVKNKLSDKITFTFVGTDAEGNTTKKELVIQKDGKECVFELPKGIYTYEIILANKETFKKGEYKFLEETTIMVKQDQ